ncbi:MAG TPA: response regulator transcription factor [Tepiditoga sp.]|nr:response regulator transcription factor [Thermotogota bacterium]HOO73957.1 response regulator transcription factor [Tepiditoga sp.]
MIKVMIVDDQALIREGISMLLSFSEDIKIISEASNGREAIEKIEKEKPDVVLMDIRMPVMDGVEATEKIKKMHPEVKVIILTTFKEDEYIFYALKNGANGYILKDVKSEEIIKAIRAVYTGNVLLQSEIANKVVDILNNFQTKSEKEIEIKGPYEALTHRESEIALLVVEGKSNKEIAEKLFITEGTVKNHISNVLSKLQVRDRTQLVLYLHDYFNKG